MLQRPLLPLRGLREILKSSKEGYMPDMEVLEQGQPKASDDPNGTLGNLPKMLNVSAWTISMAIHEDLRCESYVLKVRQILPKSMKAKRLVRFHTLLTSLKHAAMGLLCFFYDKKVFRMDAKINIRNDRRIPQVLKDVPVVGKTKFLASAHVWRAVSNKGNIMPPHFFQKGQTFTKEVYSVIMRHGGALDGLWGCGEAILVPRDRVPAHTLHLEQNWLDDNLDLFWCEEFWPPSSPDLSPFDYHV